ncbi:MAG: major facilitator superfamily transporter [Amphiamblys sp. WSBS2006]|nr:MAG: major facilitator superfamily transporter [Amphiamblys sp. WSBS2006]
MGRALCCMLYFFLNMATYSTSMFTINYLQREWNIGPHQFSYISAVGGVTFFGAVFWCYAGYRRERKTLLLLSVLHCLFLCSLFALSSFAATKTGVIRSVFPILLYGGAGFCVSGLYPLLDEMVMQLLEKENKADFGRLRVWGSVGSGAVTVLVGQILSRTGEYGWMFAVLCVSTVAFVGCISFVGASCFSVRERKKEGAKKLGSVGGEILLFLFCALVAGYGRSVLSNFFGLFLENHVLDKGRFVLVSVVVRTSAEIVGMHYGGAAVSLIGSRQVFCIGLFANVLRLAGYGFCVTENYAVLSAVEVCRGVASSFTIVGGIKLVCELAPREHESVLLGVFSGVYGGLASFAAGVVGGALISRTELQRGAKTVFQISSGINAAGFLLHSVVCFSRAPAEKRRGSEREALKTIEIEAK